LSSRCRFFNLLACVWQVSFLIPSRKISASIANSFIRASISVMHAVKFASDFCIFLSANKTVLFVEIVNVEFPRITAIATCSGDCKCRRLSPIASPSLADTSCFVIPLDLHSIVANPVASRVFVLLVAVANPRSAFKVFPLRNLTAKSIVIFDKCRRRRRFCRCCVTICIVIAAHLEPLSCSCISVASNDQIHISCGAGSVAEKHTIG
jgi:hypothetical protein